MLNEDIEDYIENEVKHFIEEYELKQEIIDNEITDEYKAFEQLNLYDKVTEWINTDWANILNISDARTEVMAMMELITEIDDECLYRKIAYETITTFLANCLFELLEQIFNEILTDYIIEILQDIEDENDDEQD